MVSNRVADGGGRIHRLSYNRALSVLVTHLAARKDEENREALQEKLSDWLVTECEWSKNDPDEQGLERAMSWVTSTGMLTAQVA